GRERDALYELACVARLGVRCRDLLRVRPGEPGGERAQGAVHTRAHPPATGAPRVLLDAGLTRLAPHVTTPSERRRRRTWSTTSGRAFMVGSACGRRRGRRGEGSAFASSNVSSSSRDSRTRAIA